MGPHTQAPCGCAAAAALPPPLLLRFTFDQPCPSKQQAGQEESATRQLSRAADGQHLLECKHSPSISVAAQANIHVPQQAADGAGAQLARAAYHIQ